MSCIFLHSSHLGAPVRKQLGGKEKWFSYATKTGRQAGKLQAGGVLRGAYAEQYLAVKEPRQSKTNGEESYQVKRLSTDLLQSLLCVYPTALPLALVVSPLLSPILKIMQPNGE